MSESIRYNVGDRVKLTRASLSDLAERSILSGAPAKSYLESLATYADQPAEVLMTHLPNSEIMISYGHNFFHVQASWVTPFPYAEGAPHTFPWKAAPAPAPVVAPSAPVERDPGMRLIIQISGPAASGKTTAAAAIAQVLKDHGIEVSIKDHDDDVVLARNMPKATASDRLRHLAERGLKVTIDTVTKLRARGAKA